jgi:hypothetical protein
MVTLFESSDFVIQADEEGITVRSIKDKTFTIVPWDKIQDAYDYCMDSEGWE